MPSVRACSTTSGISAENPGRKKTSGADSAIVVNSAVKSVSPLACKILLAQLSPPRSREVINKGLG